MFYEEPIGNWGDQGDLPRARNTTGVFEDIDSIDPSPDFDSNLGDMSWDMSMWSESPFALQNLEPQLQLFAPGPTTTMVRRYP